MLLAVEITLVGTEVTSLFGTITTDECEGIVTTFEVGTDVGNQYTGTMTGDVM